MNWSGFCIVGNSQINADPPLERRSVSSDSFHQWMTVRICSQRKRRRRTTTSDVSTGDEEWKSMIYYDCCCSYSIKRKMVFIPSARTHRANKQSVGKKEKRETRLHVFLLTESRRELFSSLYFCVLCSHGGRGERRVSPVIDLSLCLGFQTRNIFQEKEMIDHVGYRWMRQQRDFPMKNSICERLMIIDILCEREGERDWTLSINENA